MNTHNSEHSEDNNRLAHKANHSPTANSHPHRRIIDSFLSRKPLRSFNLDRRMAHYDRRSIGDTDYHGPARRLTVDRRMRTRDRRMTQH